MIITGHHALIQRLLEPEWTPSRHGFTKELINAHVCLDPAVDLLCPVWTPRDSAYIAAQLAWYLRGDKHDKSIATYHPEMWSRTDFVDINSNYGDYVFSPEFGCQFDTVIQRLTEDKSTRNAVIMFNHAACNTSGTKDPICTTSLQFLVRTGRLYCIATMRSNSWWTGFRYDSVFFMQLQEWLAAILGVPLGLYYHNAGSLHIYDKDLERLQDNVAFTNTLSNVLQPVPAAPVAPSVEEVRWQRYNWAETEQEIRSACLSNIRPYSPDFGRTRWMINALCNYYSR